MSRKYSLRSNVIQLLLLVLGIVTISIWHNDHLDRLRWVQEGAMRLPLRTKNHVRRRDGLLEVNMAARHPIREFMDEAEEQWKGLKARQSKTLEDAVKEYWRRNDYAPPAGFDLWWEFAQEHNVLLVDEFDQINYDVTPYLALSPATFRARSEALADIGNSFHINVTNGQMDLYGPWWAHGNSLGTHSLALPFSGALPNLVLHANAEARVMQWIGEDLRRAAAEKVKTGQYFTDTELQRYENVTRNPHKDLKNACLPDDPVFIAANSTSTPTFIASHLTYMSPCSNPQVHDTPPLSFEPRAKPPRLVPQFVYGKMRPDSSFVLPGPMAPFYEPLLQTAHTWEERRGTEKLFWRGTSTGWNWSKGFARTRPDITWRDGLRAKLALMFGDAPPGESKDVEVMVEKECGLVMERFRRRWLNEQWMDVGLLGEPIYCDRRDGTCDEMRQAPMWKDADRPFKGSERKYVVDVDSNGRSELFHRYLGWGNVVFKATLYTEWNHDWLIPYYHYIPIQTDYSDVYNHMAFFLGDPRTGLGGHEDLAEKISHRASTFARECWRWEDMQAYMFRLLLEYARLWSEDREAASFKL